VQSPPWPFCNAPATGVTAKAWQAFRRTAPEDRREGGAVRLQPLHAVEAGQALTEGSDFARTPRGGLTNRPPTSRLTHLTAIPDG